MIQMKKYNLDETVESERELRGFVDAFLKYLVRTEIFDNVKERVESSYDIEYAKKAALFLAEKSCLHMEEDDLQKIYRSDFLKPFYEYLRGYNKQKRAFRININISESGPNKKYRCYYLSERNLIYLQIISFELKSEMITTILRNGQSKVRAKKELENLLMGSDLNSVLLHEMTHCYDDFRSKGKDRGTYTQPAVLGGDDLKYYSQDIEINAYYSMVVADIEKSNLKYCYTQYPKILSIAKSSIERHMGKIFYSKEFPEKKRDQIYSRFYSWFTTPPEGKDLKEAKDVFYSYIISQHLNDDFKNSFMDFNPKVLLNFFRDHIRKQTPPSLKGLVNEKEAYRFLIKSFKLVMKGGYLGYGTITGVPELKAGDLGYRFAFFEEFFKIFGREYVGSRVADGLRENPEYRSNSSDYKIVYGVLSFLVDQCSFTFKDFEKLESDVLIFAIFPLELLDENNIFHELMRKRG